MTFEQYWPAAYIVGDMYTKAELVVGRRTISDYELVYFPEGSDTVYELEGKSYYLRTACLVFTRPGEIHKYAFDLHKEVRHLFIHFDYEPLRLLDSRFAALSCGSGILPADNPLLAGLMMRILRSANRQAEHWKRHISVLLAALLEETAEAAEHNSEPERVTPPVPIVRAVAYMDEHLSEPITVEKIAKQSGWTHEHFTRVFSSMYGMTPKKAILDRRLRRAEQLMIGNSATIKQIAYEVGFRDEHHFSRMFKRIRGITPSEYIKKCQDPFFLHSEASQGHLDKYQINSLIVVNHYIK